MNKARFVRRDQRLFTVELAWVTRFAGRGDDAEMVGWLGSGDGDQGLVALNRVWWR